MMVPYLVDPNTGKEMFESADIVRLSRRDLRGPRVTPPKFETLLVARTARSGDSPSTGPSDSTRWARP